MMKTLNLDKYKTVGGAARALHKHIIEELDGDEAVLMSPKQSEALGYGKVWRVMWEGGMYEWGVKLSLNWDCDRGAEYREMGVKHNPQDNKNWFMEPYYSFDVGFCKA